MYKSLFLSTFLVSASLAGGASAQNATDFQLQDIVVTAQKRAESQQQVPISIAVMGSEDLEARGITNIALLDQTTPNLRIAPMGTSPTSLRVFIRGLGPVDTQLTQDPPVGIYVNGIYIARATALSLDIPDLERVEVLRGPQGTLYGRNSTGGAINLITKRPNDELSASQLLSFGNLGSVRAQSYVNIPLTDRIFISGSYSADMHNGWIRNLGVGPDFGKLESEALRFNLRLKPTDSLTIDYAFDRAVNHYTLDYFHLAVPSGPGSLVPGLPAQPHRLREAQLLAPFHPSRDAAQGHTITATLETPIGELRSLTGFRRVETHAYNDDSGNPFVTIFRNAYLDEKEHQFSQEFQLVGSTGNGRFDYVTGLYYFSESGRDHSTDYFFDFPLPRNINVRNRTYAAYGQLTWRPGGEDAPFSVTGGLRYMIDKREADNHMAAPASREDRKLIGSLAVDYRLSRDAMVYAKVAQGYKAGGYNIRQADFTRSFGPENLISYEGGLKSEFLNHRVRFNVALFYMQYRDIQLDIMVPGQPDPTLTNTVNAGRAWIRGGEIEATVVPLDGLRLSLNYGLTDSKVTRVLGDDPALYTLAQAPKHSLSGSVQWDVVRTDLGSLNFRVDTAYHTSTAATARQLPYQYIPGYSLTDARLSFVSDRLMPGGQLTVTAWVRNLFDKEYFKEAFPTFGSVHAYRIGSYGLPRTFGVEMKIKY